MDILNGVLTNIIAAPLIFLLGIVCDRVWQHLREREPALAFWRLDLADGVLFAISLRGQDPSEYAFYIPTGDTLALGEIASFLKSHYPNLQDKFYPDPHKPLIEWERTVVLIGGGKNNITTRCLLAALDPPLYSRDHEDQKHDFKGLKDRNRNIVLTPDEELLPDGSKRIHMDHAYVIRTLDPLNRNKHVFVIIGGYTIGTYAAARWLSQTKNLRWLSWQCMWQRLVDFIQRRPPFDSIEIVLQVDVLSHVFPMVLPAIGDAKLWCHELDGNQVNKGKPAIRDRRKPYYFSVPKDYNTRYNYWLGVAHSEWINHS